MVNVDHFDDLGDFLNSCVGALKKRFPHYSATQLAKTVDVTQSSFNRVKNQNVDRPTFNTAFKIVRAACGEEKVQSFIKRFYPEMSETIERAYPGNADVPFVAPAAETFFQDSTTHEIMMMATTHAGLSREKTLEEFGKKGLAVLNKLLQEGILKEVDNKISIEGTVNATQETVHMFLQNLIKMNYDVDAFGDNKNWLSVQYESVKRDVVVPQLREIYIRLNQEIRSVMTAPESKGPDVVWAGLVMDSMSKHADLLERDNKKVLQ